MKSKLTPVSDNHRYQNFKKPLDRALEKVLHVHLTAIDQVMAKLEERVMDLSHSPHVLAATRAGQGPIISEISQAAVRTIKQIKNLRQKAYLLSHAGEAEALARTLGKQHQSTTRTRDHARKNSPSGGTLEERIFLYFNDLAIKIQRAIRIGQINAEPLQDTLDRVARAFPKRRKLKSTPALSRRKLKEADDVPGQRQVRNVHKLSVGITDDDMWSEILEEYNSTVLPPDIFKRGPEDQTLYYDITTEETTERYTWEVEQEVTEDFVRSVRSGTQEAAKENGITDFMWIAVIDAKTDNCCLVRDGKSSSQIENELEEGKIDEDECDAIVAPAHFNCRCSSAPMTEDIPEKVDYDFSSFDDWLEGKANGE